MAIWLAHGLCPLETIVAAPLTMGMGAGVLAGARDWSTACFWFLFARLQRCLMSL